MADLSGLCVLLVTPSRDQYNAITGVLADLDTTLVYYAAVHDCPSSAWQDCDLAVIDLGDHSRPGIGLLADLERTRPTLPKLALVNRRDIPTAIQAIRAGATHCVEKTTDSDKLLAEIRTLLAQSNGQSADSKLALTRTETTVLRLVLEGKTTREIARALHRSSRTIDVHRHHIMHKFGASGMVDLAKAAVSMGLFPS